MIISSRNFWLLKKPISIFSTPLSNNLMFVLLTAIYLEHEPSDGYLSTRYVRQVRFVDQATRHLCFTSIVFKWNIRMSNALAITCAGRACITWRYLHITRSDRTRISCISTRKHPAGSARVIYSGQRFCLVVLPARRPIFPSIPKRFLILTSSWTPTGNWEW